MRETRVGSTLRAAVALAAGAAALAGQSTNAATPFVLNFNCMVSYSAQGSVGQAGGTCVGSVIPLGGATAALTLRAAYDDEKETITGATGTLTVTMINNATFTIALTGGGASRDAAGRVVITSGGVIQAGTGTLDGATGSATVALTGVPVNDGTATVSVGGEGSIAAPGLAPGPAVALGPGLLGNPLSSGGASCGNPVTVSNGNMYHQFTDLSVAARGRGLAVKRTYNSQASATAGPFGYGWTHNLQSAIFDRGATAVYRTESGGSVTFTASGGGYLPTPEGGLVLSREAGGWLIAAREGMRSRFDAQGRLTEMADANGNRQSLSYGTAGRLESVSEPQGGRIQFSYDSAGRIRAVEDQTGRRVTYEYDEAGNLAASTDAGGARTEYRYSSGLGRSHVLMRIVLPGERGAGFEYSESGRVTRTEDSAGGVMEVRYAAGRTEVKDAPGGVTAYTFDAQGRITQVQNADGTTTRRVLDEAGRMMESLDEEGFKTTFTYDGAGRQLTKTDALGRTARFAYDEASGRMTAFTDAAGNETKYEYDERGNLAKVTDPLGGETVFAHDAQGGLVSRTDALGRKTAYRYTAEGLPESAGNAAGLLAAAELDELRRVKAARDAAGREERYEYDALDRVVKTTDSVLGVSTGSYGKDGHVASITSEAGATTKFAYDTLGNLARTTDAAGGATEYEYRPWEGKPAVFGLVSAVRDARGKVSRLEYDAMGRVVAAVNAAGGVRRYSWTARGDLAALQAEDGAVTSFEYDAVRRPVRQRLPDGSAREFTHDARGNVLTAGNAEVAYEFTYDAAGRTTSVKDSRGPWVVRYGYNAAGQRTLMSAEGIGETRYEYDDAGRPSKVAAPEGEYAFAYNERRQRAGVTFPNGMAAAYAHDAAGRLTAIEYRPRGEAAAVRMEWTYDAAGNAATVNDAEGAHSYGYDSLRRLVSASHPARAKEAYSYDAAGNRTGGGEEYGDDNRLLAGAGVRYGYDRKGNVASRESAEGTAWFEYGFDNRLTGVMMPDGRWAAYKYDPFGRRIEKNVMGTVTRYVYDADRLLLEVDEAGNVKARYTYRPQSDEALGMARGGAVYTYMTDGRGNVIGLAGMDGRVAQMYSHGAFGQDLTIRGGEVENPIVFAMGERDAETGLIHMGARHYDPSTGRFLQKDPIDVAAALNLRQKGRSGRGASAQAVAGLLMRPAAANPYVYALNNPLTYTDRSGMFFDLLGGLTKLAGLLGGATGGPAGGSGSIGGIVGSLLKAGGLFPGLSGKISTVGQPDFSNLLGSVLGGNFSAMSGVAELIQKLGGANPAGLQSLLPNITNPLNSGTGAQSCSVPQGDNVMLNPDQIYLNQVNQQAADAQALYNSTSTFDIQQAQASMQQQAQLYNMLMNLMQQEHETNVQVINNIK